MSQGQVPDIPFYYLSSFRLLSSNTRCSSSFGGRAHPVHNILIVLCICAHRYTQSDYQKQVKS